MRSVCGKGVYESSDPEFGSVLRIVVSDPSGNFEFLLVEQSGRGALNQAISRNVTTGFLSPAARLSKDAGETGRGLQGGKSPLR